MKKYWAILLFNFILLSSIINANSKSNNSPVKLTIYTNNVAQTIYGFGASDAWGCQFIGKNWPLEKRDKIADWLFSKDTLQNGQPKGIGLSIWRFNIGGGTTEQGDSSYITDEWRRAECFLNNDNTYDWSKQAGQQWFLQAAKQRKVHSFIAFSNTPPVYFTKNGKGWSAGGNSSNLKPEKYNDYARFLVDVLQYFNQKGFDFDILSPQNEPQWNWDGKGQEGTPALNSEVYGFVNQISRQLATTTLKTKIEITEAGQLTYLYQDSTNLPGRDNQLVCFFDTKSPLYLGALPNISHSIAGHSYFTTYNNENLINTRLQLHKKIQTIDKSIKYNMTEYCVLEDNIEIKGQGRDLGMNTALYVAKVIHNDLTVANASSWQWWVAVSPYDYKDGLVYTDLNKTDGNIFDSKLMWGLGQYSRFIRPGMIRVEASVTGDTEVNLLVSAFKTADNKKVVVVMVNQSSNSVKVKIDKTNFKIIKMFCTSQETNNNMFPVGTFKSSDKITIPARAITTLEMD